MMTKLLLAVLQDCRKRIYRKSNFLITFDYLVSADPPTINYKSRLRTKLTQTLDFSQIPISHIAHRFM